MRSILVNNKPHIVFFDSAEVPDTVFKMVSDYGIITKLDLNHPSNRSDLKKEIGSANILWVALGQKIDEDLLKSSPFVTDIISVTTGLSHIDVDYLKKKKIRLHCLRGEDKFLEQLTATAEHTWGLILSLQRKIFSSYQDVIKGNWRRDGFKGRELQGRTLGLIGLGRLGKKVASFGHAFGMEVIGFDSYPRNIAEYIKMTPSVESVLKNADIVSLHIHATPENHNLISKDFLNLLHSESYLINTARGELVDEKELVILLKEKRIAGYAADVVNDECSKEKTPIQKHALTNPDNLLLTPHLGGFTHESRTKAEIFMAKKFIFYMTKK